jgi:hypothetical protein
MQGGNYTIYTSDCVRKKSYTSTTFVLDNTTVILKNNPMKTYPLFLLIALFLTTLFGSCSNDATVSTAASERIRPQILQLTTVNLRTAANFAILSKSGITNVYPSVITGNVGSGPITGAAILLSCPEVTGTIFSVDAAGPLPCRVTDASRLTTAVADMQTAYTDAAGRSNPNYLNLGAGNIGGLTLPPGLYKWTSAVTIPTDITLSGNPTSLWILQVSGTLRMSSAVRIHLTGGAQAKNIFWQVSEDVTLGTTSHFEGTILGKTLIALNTGASINGRLLAQTAATLQSNTVTKPN